MAGENLPNDKKYTISYESDGVYLTVFPATDFLSKINENDILNVFSKKKIMNYNANLVSDTVKRSEGNPVKVADPQEEIKIDCVIEASASQDKMQGFISMTAPEGGGKGPTIEAIIHALHDKGIICGINEDRIRSLLESPVYGTNILVAEGVPAKNGKNGEVRYMIDIHRDRKPIIMEDGTVNYKDMNLIENITKDQKLAEVIPPIPGQNGMNVVGTDLKAIDGKPVNIPRGRGVYLSKDGQELFSEIDGQLMVVDGKISVFSNYEVKADVDNSTGNIKFIGNVSVRGNVLSGFEIEAGGDISVDGVVEGAILKAAGNIVLRRGMVGGGKGTLIAGGDIIAKFVESCTIEVRGDIKAEAIMHCDIKCGNNVVLGGKKGLLVGGTVRVGRLVDVKFLGNQMSTVTIVEVGVDPHLRERLKFLKGDIIKMDEGLTKSNQAVALLNRLKNAEQLNEEKRELLAKSTRAKFFYENKLSEYKKEIAEIEEKLQQGANGKFKISGSAFPGVRVAIGNSMMYIKEEIKYCSLYSDGADIRVGSY